MIVRILENKTKQNNNKNIFEPPKIIREAKEKTYSPGRQNIWLSL